MKKKVMQVMASILMFSVLCGCQSSETTKKKKKKTKKSTKVTTVSKETTEETTETPSEPTTVPSSDPSGPKSVPGGGHEYSMFITLPTVQTSDNNDIKLEIANRTGVQIKETFLTGQTPQEALGAILASGNYPDLLYAGNELTDFYQMGALVAWDDYLNDPAYSNLRNMYTDKEWEMFRQSDGHIYWADVYGTQGESKNPTHNDLAFWIQVRVLEWAGYPKIETLDEYFDLLERYAAENPEGLNGEPLIPYTMLCDDWRYYCLYVPPICLAGYPDESTVAVDDSDPDHPVIVDYNDLSSTREYYQKLNEEYHKGIVDPDFLDMTYDTYIQKLATGNVLGMCDQWWDFAYNVNDYFKSNGLDKLGCNYVPLGLAIEKGTPNYWHVENRTINTAGGVAVTTQCMDPDEVFAFMNRLLDQDMLDLRFWGIEGVDYEVDDQGLYYRTEKMRTMWEDYSYLGSHACPYSYLPQYKGTSEDGINAILPQEQPSEVFAELPEKVQECFTAYGCSTYVDFIDSDEKELGPWFPMYLISNSLPTGNPPGDAWNDIQKMFHKMLPELVMADDFDEAWDAYLKAYEGCNPEQYLDYMQQQLDIIVQIG